MTVYSPLPLLSAAEIAIDYQIDLLTAQGVRTLCTHTAHLGDKQFVEPDSSFLASETAVGRQPLLERHLLACSAAFGCVTWPPQMEFAQWSRNFVELILEG